MKAISSIEIIGEAGKDKNNGSIRVKYKCSCGHIGETRKARAIKLSKCPKCLQRKQNRYYVIGDVAVIDVSTPKHKAAWCFIDVKDLGVVLDGNGRWFATNFGSEVLYACRNIKGVKIHRHIVSAKKENTVDHLDGNGLNNTRKNIRVTTQAENNCNRVMSSRNTSGANGVYIDKNGKYVAQASKGKKHFFIGKYESLSDAEKARKRFDKENGFTERHGCER